MLFEEDLRIPEARAREHFFHVCWFVAPITLAATVPDYGRAVFRKCNEVTHGTPLEGKAPLGDYLT
jgi:hypothetical protein